MHQEVAAGKRDGIAVGAGLDAAELTPGSDLTVPVSDGGERRIVQMHSVAAESHIKKLKRLDRDLRSRYACQDVTLHNGGNHLRALAEILLFQKPPLV